MIPKSGLRARQPWRIEQLLTARGIKNDSTVHSRGANVALTKASPEEKRYNELLECSAWRRSVRARTTSHASASARHTIFSNIVILVETYDRNRLIHRLTSCSTSPGLLSITMRLKHKQRSCSDSVAASNLPLFDDYSQQQSRVDSSSMAVFLTQTHGTSKRSPWDGPSSGHL